MVVLLLSAPGIQTVGLSYVSMSNPGDTQFNRGPLFVALGLSIALVIGVLAGAKLMYRQALTQPVVLGSVSAPLATSSECADFISSLPKKLGAMPRAELANPKPEGAAAYAVSPTKQVTIRCGVEAPLQYTALSDVHEAAGSKWLRVVDTTPGSDLETWFSVSRAPIIAVTANKAALPAGGSPVKGLEAAVDKLRTEQSHTHPIPLSQLQAPEAKSAQCAALLQSLPANLGQAYRRNTAVPLPDATAVWTAADLEPVVLRCGVAQAPGYRPGAQLNQVNEIPWFEDTTLANGTTAGTFYALGRDINVAVSMPQGAGNTAIVALSDTIAANTQAR